VPDIDRAAEWLETDGLGGYASGTVGTFRTRRYHGVRITATTPPTGRVVLVAGIEAVVDRGAGDEALVAQCYQPGVVHPTPATLESFALDPWPIWTHVLSDGSRIRSEVLCTAARARTLLRWTRIGGHGQLRLRVRPLLAARDYHSLQHENGSVDADVVIDGASASWRLYDGTPPVACLSNGEWRVEPAWYRRFLYEAERDRGLDAVEDLFVPGSIVFDLDRSPAVIALGQPNAFDDVDRDELAGSIARAADIERQRRAALGGPLAQAADQYLVRRGIGRTLVAGYPWFTDWGRDTFIAMRGICLSTGRLEAARDILLEWTGATSRGMLPNRFPDGGEAPEYNAVDASLWFVIVAGELLAHRDAPGVLSAHDRFRIESTVLDILEGYARGTRYGIRCTADGLLAAGESGVQLTWMDARVGNRVITPRIGKPVEVQALWINALAVGSGLSRRWHPIERAARESFATRFWNADRHCLFDVVDVDHESGRVDASVRPNQILAVGGLPHSLLPPDRARAVVDLVERTLWTPLGLRSLAPDDASYAARYAGNPAERDAVYHQGTVWPWLIGPFVEAWLRAREESSAAKAEAARRFLAPIEHHLETAGLGHVAEVADGDPPHRPGGCPFQAWSLGELIRVRILLDTNHHIAIH
jgi:predicted glycogen debranching enzyme